MENIQHPTSNVQRPLLGGARSCFRWMSKVEGRLLNVFFALLLAAPRLAQAQTPVQLSPDVQAQIQLQQSPVDVSPPENISATAEFDPPVVRVGEKAFYRVTLNTTQNSIAWPEQIAAPDALKLAGNARGQVVRLDENKFRPLTAFLYEVTASSAG